MATTYLQVCNLVLSELNEVLLTSSNFASAVNVQLHVQNAVNKAYQDINAAKYKWPWLSAAAPSNESYGNVAVDTVAGTRWYLLKAGAADINADYGHVDWENFLLTEEGAAGKTAPYTMRMLPYISLQEWQDHWMLSEEKDKSDAQTYGVPKRVIRSPDGRRFGLSPIPDGIYKVYFYAYDRPVDLSAHGDTVAIPDQWVSVLISRTLYYIWKRKENTENMQACLAEYEAGLKDMQQQEITPQPDSLTDDRVRYV
jgi:hypothetical protein